MKKILLFILIVLLAATICVVCFACADKEEVTSVTISFDTGFKDIVIAPIVLDGQSDKYMPADPVKLGYEFLGWYYDERCTLAFSVDDPITMDITLHAKWFKLQNGGAGDGSGEKETDESTGMVFELSGEAYSLIGYNGNETIVTVPARYNFKPVTKIKKTAFINTSVKRVNFGRLIESVEEGTFGNALNLEYINVDAGSTYYCSENGVLYNTPKTVLVCAPAKLAATEYVLPSTVTGITDYAMQNCAFEFSFGDSTYVIIDEYDFGGFAGTVTIGSGISAIRRHAFNNATCEVIFTNDNGVTELPMQAFENYYGQELVLPGTIGLIAPYAFAGCTASLDLSKLGLTTVTGKAFARYAGKNLVVPATVNTIEKYAFESCTAEITFEFGSVYAEVKEDAFSSYGGTVTYVDDNGETVHEYRGKVTFPSAVAKVSANAFRNSNATVVFDNGQSNVEISGTLSNFGGEIKYLK